MCRHLRKSALEEISNAARSVRILADYLERMAGARPHAVDVVVDEIAEP